MNSNWINVYNEWNQDLTQYEVLVVGEKDGKVFKSVNAFPQDIEIHKVVLWIDNQLTEYNKL